MVVNALIDTVAGVIMGFVPGIGVEVLAGANVNFFGSPMAIFDFAVPKPLGEFSC